MSERATVINWSEKSAEAVVAASNGRRAEREGGFARRSVGCAKHQKSAKVERSASTRGEAERDEGSGEARSVRQAPTDSGRASLLGQALTRENLVRAWQRVKTNAGSGGVDGLSVGQTAEHLKVHWPQVKEQLLAGSYRPMPVRRVQIPKPGGGVRELGIPTVTDRLIQQALLQVLQPLIDPSFSDHSYGFRPGRRAHDAICQAQAYVQAGYRTVVDVDLERFFDGVNHDVLMDRLRKRIADRAVLWLIRRYLQAGIMVHGVVQERYGARRKAGRCRRYWPTYCSMKSTVSWNDAGIALCATPTTAMCTCAVNVRASG
jgi:RNA-directed DNA polymerase